MILTYLAAYQSTSVKLDIAQPVKDKPIFVPISEPVQSRGTNVRHYQAKKIVSQPNSDGNLTWIILPVTLVKVNFVIPVCC